MKSTDLRPNHRILIVDDTTSIHDDFREILCPDNSDEAAANALETVLFEEDQPEGMSFQLDSAYQGQQALEMVQKALADDRPYALAFVDVRMPPGWDGIETIARIWQADPELQIVVCTAYADYSWQEMRVRVGQPDNLLVLKKPFDNIEVQQLAHALTKKWLLSFQTRLQIAELARTNESLGMSRRALFQGLSRKPASKCDPTPSRSALRGCQSTPRRGYGLPAPGNDRPHARPSCSCGKSPRWWLRGTKLCCGRNRCGIRRPSCATGRGVSREMLVSLSRFRWKANLIPSHHGQDVTEQA